MKHLIIFAHPLSESLNGQFKNTIHDTLLQAGEEVVVRDLNELNFAPTLTAHDMAGQRAGKVEKDVETEQSFIAWADCLTFIYPIWWTGMPAIMKGYIDRVFSYGFAYSYQGGVQMGLLKGKKTIVVNTHGKSKLEYGALGMDKALSLTSDTGVYSYCGLEMIQHFFFDQADRATPETIQAWKNEITELYQSQFLPTRVVEGH